MRKLIAFTVHSELTVNLISIMLVILGVAAMITINREAFPNVNLDTVQINAVYPGATPAEVERLVVIPIEQELKALDGIDKMTSIAFPGSARIILELDPRATGRKRITSDVQLAVDRAVLPEDLPTEPVVLEIDGAVFPVINLAVAADVSPLELKRLGDRIADDILEIDGVARVQVQGDRKAEMRIVVDPDKLKRYRLSIGDISNVVTGWNINAPGGELKLPHGQKSVRIVGEFRNAEDLGNVVLRANDQARMQGEAGHGNGALRLRDVASVTETLEEPQVLYDVSGIPSLNIIILKKSASDIITTVDLIKDYMQTIPERYGAGVRITPFVDFSRFARLRLGVLTNNGVVGIVFVLIVLGLFLRPAVAITTTWGLPIVFCTGLFVLYVTGTTLNLISMLGFIMVLGMLVDDAIIIGENITWHMERGMAAADAAVTGARELIGPVTTTVATTVVAFMPLMFMSGIIGKFIYAIPVVVITLLWFSWLESFLALPSHVVTVVALGERYRAWHDGRRVRNGLAPKPVNQREAHPVMSRLEDWYIAVLRPAITHRWITIGIAVATLILSGVLAATQMKFQLFPSVGVDQFMARVTAPAGTTLDEMRQTMRAVDKAMRQRIDAKYLEATILSTGQIAVDAGDPLTQRGSRFGQIRVVYIPAVLRPDHEVLEDMQRHRTEIPPLFPKLEISFGELKPGPPTGRALEAEISSHTPGAAEQAAQQLLDHLQKIPGVSSVESGLQAGDDELHVVLDRALASYAGVDLAAAASHVRAAVGGLRVGTTRRGTEEIDITIRYPEAIEDKLAALQELAVSNRRGGLVPLKEIARFESKPGYTTIRHRAGIRVVTIVANIDPMKITSAELNRRVAAEEKQWMGPLAEAVRVNYGGEEEKNKESIIDLMKSFVFAMVGIFFILAIQFNRLSYALVVMTAIPFGIIGIIIAFYLHDTFWRVTPLSFFALMGMVALSGVVVNSALVLLVFVKRAREEGMELFEAILTAGRRRLRAVVLTATTTVVGLLPTAYGWGGYDPFVASMALALSWGLIFATVITLVAIPALLVAATDVREFIKRILRITPKSA